MVTVPAVHRQQVRSILVCRMSLLVAFCFLPKNFGRRWGHTNDSFARKWMQLEWWGAHSTAKKRTFSILRQWGCKTLSMSPRAFISEPGTAPVVIPTLLVPPLANLYVYRCFCVFLFLEDTSPFYGATDTPVLDFLDRCKIFLVSGWKTSAIMRTTG